MAWYSWPDDITTDELVPATWLTGVSQSFTFLEEIARQTVTANTSITATTEATANTVVTTPSATYAAVPIVIEAWFPEFVAGTGTSRMYIFEDTSTVLGTAVSIGSGLKASPVPIEFIHTPTAAAHTYSIRAMVASGTGTVSAGVGGSGNVFLPGRIRTSYLVV